MGQLVGLFYILWQEILHRYLCEWVWMFVDVVMFECESLCVCVCDPVCVQAFECGCGWGCESVSVSVCKYVWFEAENWGTQVWNALEQETIFFSKKVSLVRVSANYSNFATRSEKMRIETFLAVVEKLKNSKRWEKGKKLSWQLTKKILWLLREIKIVVTSNENLARPLWWN